MLIIGCDYHPGFQQIAFVDTETGELGERRLAHREEAEQFYGEPRLESANLQRERSRSVLRKSLTPPTLLEMGICNSYQFATIYQGEEPSKNPRPSRA